MDPVSIVTTAIAILNGIKQYGEPLLKTAMKYTQKPNPSQADVDALFKDIADLDYTASYTAARDRRDKLDGTGIHATPGGTP